MIRKKIKEIAEQRGFKTPYQLQKAMGTKPNLANRLWDGDFEMIGLQTIDRLCKALKCQPGDLLEYVEDKE